MKDEIALIEALKAALDERATFVIKQKRYQRDLKGYTKYFRAAKRFETLVEMMTEKEQKVMEPFLNQMLSSMTLLQEYVSTLIGADSEVTYQDYLKLLAHFDSYVSSYQEAKINLDRLRPSSSETARRMMLQGTPEQIEFFYEQGQLDAPSIELFAKLEMLHNEYRDIYLNGDSIIGCKLALIAHIEYLDIMGPKEDIPIMVNALELLSEYRAESPNAEEQLIQVKTALEQSKTLPMLSQVQKELTTIATREHELPSKRHAKRIKRHFGTTGAYLYGKFVQSEVADNLKYAGSDLNAMMSNHGGRIVTDIKQTLMPGIGNSGGLCFGFAQQWGAVMNHFDEQNLSIEAVEKQLKFYRAPIDDESYLKQKSQLPYRQANLVSTHIPKDKLHAQLSKQLKSSQDDNFSLVLGLFEERSQENGHAFAVKKNDHGLWFYDSNGYVMLFEGSDEKNLQGLTAFLNEYMERFYAQFQGNFEIVKVQESQAPVYLNTSLSTLTSDAVNESIDSSMLDGPYKEANLFILQTLKDRIEALKSQQKTHYLDDRDARLKSLQAIYTQAYRLAQLGLFVDIQSIETNIRNDLKDLNSSDVHTFEEGTRKESSGKRSGFWTVVTIGGILMSDLVPSQYAKMLQSIEKHPDVIEAKRLSESQNPKVAVSKQNTK